MQSLRKVQPGKPAFISELYTDYMNCWGWPVSSYPTTEMVLQQTMETLAAGGMYSYFMFYGGTNFGFWASTTWKSDESFVTTRYYSRAPLNEGAAFNDTYFAAKAANLLALNFQEFLTAGEASSSPVVISRPVRAEAVRTRRGYLLFVHPRFPYRVASVYHTDGRSGSPIQLSEEWPFSEIAHQAGVLELPNERLALAESSSYPAMLPFQLEIDPNCRIDYANSTLFGTAGTPQRRVLLFRGQVGARGVCSVNGERAEFILPPAEPVRLETGGVTILGLSHFAADRAWFTGERVLIGPAYAGEARDGQHECFLDGQSSSVVIVSKDGKIASRPLKPVSLITAYIPLTRWTALPLPETQSPMAGWQ